MAEFDIGPPIRYQRQYNYKTTEFYAVNDLFTILRECSRLKYLYNEVLLKRYHSEDLFSLSIKEISENAQLLNDHLLNEMFDLHLFSLNKWDECDGTLDDHLWMFLLHFEKIPPSTWNACKSKIPEHIKRKKKIEFEKMDLRNTFLLSLEEDIAKYVYHPSRIRKYLETHDVIDDYFLDEIYE